MKYLNATALLIIDMQNDFVDERGVLPVAGAKATIADIAAFADEIRRRGAKVIHVIRRHDPSGSDAEPFRRHLFESGSGYCVEGTPGAEIVAGLEPDESDIVVVKTRFSAFFRTDLDDILEANGIRRIIIAGTQYPNCIRATAVDALSRDYRVEIATDCCSAASSEVEAANISDMKAMGIDCRPWRELL